MGKSSCTCRHLFDVQAHSHTFVFAAQHCVQPRAVELLLLEAERSSIDSYRVSDIRRSLQMSLNIQVPALRPAINLLAPTRQQVGFDLTESTVKS
jgi:hypothetical protein